MEEGGTGARYERGSSEKDLMHGKFEEAGREQRGGNFSANLLLDSRAKVKMHENLSFLPCGHRETIKPRRKSGTSFNRVGEICNTGKGRGEKKEMNLWGAMIERGVCHWRIVNCK